MSKVSANAIKTNKPQVQVIWECVQKNQPIDYKGVTELTNLRRDIVSSNLSLLEKRGLVVSAVPTLGTRKEYTTTLSTYTFVPHSKPRYSFSKKLSVLKPTKVSTQTSYTEEIENMTVARARGMWMALNKMFANHR